SIMATQEPITIPLELPSSDETVALAQYVKRIGYEDVNKFASPRASRTAAVPRRMSCGRRCVSFSASSPTPASPRGDPMVARTRTEAELLVIFSRDGENDEAKIVPSPERAAVTAVLMIAGRGSLHAGDQLLVQHDDKAD